MEELLLGTLLAGDELDVVHQQYIHGMEAIAEGDHAVKAQRVDHLHGELLGANIGEPHRRDALFDRVAHGLHQVGLAHAHPAVQEQRVVGFRGRVGHGQGGRVGKLVRCPDHKCVKGVARVELMLYGIKVEPRLLDCRCGRARGRAGGRLRFRADKVEPRIRETNLKQNCLQQLAIGFRQPLAEKPRRHPHQQLAVLNAFLPGRAKPGSKTMRVDAALHVLEDLLPRIHRLVALAELEKMTPATISTGVEILWKN